MLLKLIKEARFRRFVKIFEKRLKVHDEYFKQKELSLVELDKQLKEEKRLMKISQENDRIYKAKEAILYREIGLVPPCERN